MSMIYNSTRPSYPRCTAVLGSMTMALKAQRVLSKETIRAETVKISRSSSNKGCIYGVEFDCPLLGNVKSTLDRAGIDIKEFLR